MGRTDSCRHFRICQPCWEWICCRANTRDYAWPIHSTERVLCDFLGRSGPCDAPQCGIVQVKRSCVRCVTRQLVSTAAGNQRTHPLLHPSPCPGISACGDNFVVLSDAEFDSLALGAGFSCGYIANVSHNTAQARCDALYPCRPDADKRLFQLLLPLPHRPGLAGCKLRTRWRQCLPIPRGQCLRRGIARPIGQWSCLLPVHPRWAACQGHPANNRLIQRVTRCKEQVMCH